MFDDIIGIPFEDGGRTRYGVDCWGAVLLVFEKYGIILPDYRVDCMNASKINDTVEQATATSWIALEKPIIPCVVVMRFNETVLCNHTGVYIGNGKFIHAREKVGINIDRLDSPAWRRKIEGFYIPRGVSYYDKIDYTEKSI